MKLKILVLFLLSLWVFPPTAFAGNFSCTNDKSIGSTSARIQVEGNNIHNFIVVLSPVPTAQNPSYALVNATSLTAQGDTKATYFFDTKPSTTYKVQVVNSSYGLVEEIKTCQFKTLDVNQSPPIIPNPPANPPTPTTPANTNNTSSSGTPTAGTIAGAGLTQQQITADKEGNGLVPCENTCDFNDVLHLINNLITFLITTLFVPIIILLFMYAGYKYITAEGNPAKVANLKKMVWHIIVGMLLVLCSWLIVKTIISVLTNDPNGVLQFLK